MRIRVDRARCSGQAMCAMTAPALYTLDDDGYSSLVEADVPAGREADARRGMAACPERAITLEE